MANYEDDDLDEEFEENDQPVDEEAEARPANNRNFILALGILGGIFVLVLVVLVLLYLNRPTDSETARIQQTNAAILAANTQTAQAATLTSAFRLTPSITPTVTETPVPPTATNTAVLAQPTETTTGTPGTPPAAAGLLTPTGNALTQTRSVPSVLTQSAQQTQTRQVSLNQTATATALPQTGFAEDVGLPGLFGLALGMVLVIVLVRRLRLSTNH